MFDIGSLSEIQTWFVDLQSKAKYPKLIHQQETGHDIVFPLTMRPVCRAGPVLHDGLYIRMVPHYDEGWQVSSEDIRTLLAECRGSAGLLLLSLTVCLRRFPRNLTPCKITDKTDSEQVTEDAQTLVSMTTLSGTLIHTGAPWLLMWQAGEQTWRWCRPHHQSPSQKPRPAPLSGTCWTWLHQVDVTSFVS